jgi:tetratricopeptide (TPR) repeat protein
MPSLARRQIVSSALWPVAIWLVIAAAVPRAVTAQDKPSAPAPVLAEARALINQDKPAAAIEKLRTVDGPGRLDVALLLGVAYYHANDHVNAIERLGPIVDRLPDGSIERKEAVQVLGLSYFLAGRYADAVPRLEATREWAADNAEFGYVLGQAYIQIRQPDRARQTFARMFGVSEDSAAAHLVAAQMMIRLEFEALAEAELKKAIEKDPKLPQANALLGQIALFRGRLDEAISLTEREIALNPTNALAFSQLGDAKVRQGKWDDAIIALQKSIWLNPFYSAPYIVLGKAYMQKGQTATAEGMLTRAIEYDPNNRSAHYLLGQLFQRAGRLEEAKREFGIAEKLQAEGRR